MSSDSSAPPAPSLPAAPFARPATSGGVGERPRILVVGAGAIGGVVASGLLAAGHDVVTLTTNPRIAAALRTGGFRLTGETTLSHARSGDVVAALSPGAGPFDYVLLATQPPQVEEAAVSAAPFLTEHGHLVCFQNGLCEHRVARTLGHDRVIGAVVAWGATMTEPGVYDRTSAGGFTVGKLAGAPDASVRRLAALLGAIGPVRITDNLLGSRWSKLAINSAVSTLGTIGGDRVGALMRHRFVRRLVAEIMTETVAVARARQVRLEKVAGTIDLEWLALTERERMATASLSLVGKHAVLLAAGFRYRRLRSSMLAAIERGRPPAVDFLNGEVVDHGQAAGIPTPVNRAARDLVWQIARREAKPSLDMLKQLHTSTRDRG